MDDSLDWSKLSKKERKKLAKEQRKKEQETEKKRVKIGKWVAIGIISAVCVLGLYWIVNAVKESSKPLTGKEIFSQGRDHISKEKWEKFKYNSNPPTSGPHDPVWVKAGIYDVSWGDGNLVHSLEHGYIVISYNCDANSSDCKKLVKDLTDLAKEKRIWKLIVVARPSLDAKIALTAWTRIDKFNEFDKERIVRFIDSFRDQGPEHTME